MESPSPPEMERPYGRPPRRMDPAPKGERAEEREPGEPEAKRPKPHPLRRRIVIGLVVVAGILGAIWAVHAYLYGLHHETTDDATIQGHISPVIPRVDGYVQKVLVDDNDVVRQGQLLAVIDPTPLRLQVQQAEAAVANARAAEDNAEAELASAQAKGKAAEAQVRAGEVARREATREARRQSQLLHSQATPRKAYDDAQSAEAESAAKLRALEQQVGVEQSEAQKAQATVARAQATLKQAQATLATARLELSYTELRAPIAGRVSQKQIEPGQYVRPGGPVMAIADERGTWVVANFKEDQIANIRPGQPVKIDVDAYSGRDFKGKVDSISGATGSEFALLPEEAANTNFVKVAKRIPVKIVFDPEADPPVMRPGMNVEVAVDTGS